MMEHEWGNFSITSAVLRSPCHRMKLNDRYNVGGMAPVAVPLPAGHATAESTVKGMGNDDRETNLASTVGKKTPRKMPVRRTGVISVG